MYPAFVSSFCTLPLHYLPPAFVPSLYTLTSCPSFAPCLCANLVFCAHPLSSDFAPHICEQTSFLHPALHSAFTPNLCALPLHPLCPTFVPNLCVLPLHQAFALCLYVLCTQPLYPPFAPCLCAQPLCQAFAPNLGFMSPPLLSSNAITTWRIDPTPPHLTWRTQRQGIKAGYKGYKGAKAGCKEWEST